MVTHHVIIVLFERDAKGRGLLEEERANHAQLLRIVGRVANIVDHLKTLWPRGMSVHVVSMIT